MIDKFKNAKKTGVYADRYHYSNKKKVVKTSYSPKRILKTSKRSNSRQKSKPKQTSALTKWLQRLLESHSEKTKQRNVIDYFIYAIYTVLADTKKTRERIIS